jgi:hypothetical protein
MTPVPCSSAVSESSGSKKSKADPSIQKKKEAVKRTQAWRMCIKLFLIQHYYMALVS